MKFPEEIRVIVMYMYLMLAYIADVVQTLDIVAVPSKPSAGQAVQLTCNIGASFAGSASWMNSLTTIATCTPTGVCLPDTARYSFTSNAVSITAAISSYDDGLDSFDWTCQFGSSSTSYSLKKDSNGSSQTNLLLLLLLLILLLLFPIFIILISCGCLDCCKCCRIFYHYDENKCCYESCYCLLKGCCSFFYCKPGIKMGKCFCGHANEKGRCGGCHSCRKKCECGWPGFCKSKKMTSCGSCYCSCCVEEIVSNGLDETSVAMTGPTASYTETKIKVHPEPRKRKKKKNKNKLDREKSAEEAVE